MAMKSVTAVLAIAVFSAATVAATARTVTNPQGNANDQSVNAVAGPPPAKKVASADKSSAQPSKKALRKSKVTPPPPLHDPN
jgi:hypothetical protein